MKILVTGPESSGKTTLCNRLSDSFNLPIYEDFSRTYLELHGKYYKYKDLLKIAFLYVNNLEVQEDNNYIQDTFLVNMKIWSLYKYGKCHSYVNDKLEQFSFDYVFLMKPDLPWIQDPYRENREDRDHLFEEYIKIFNTLNWDYNVIQGVGEERYQMAECLLQSKR
jgi:nicotinamide riboside kinase